MKEDAFGDAVAKLIQEKDTAMRAQVIVRITRTSWMIRVFSLSKQLILLAGDAGDAGERRSE